MTPTLSLFPAALLEDRRREAEHFRLVLGINRADRWWIHPDPGPAPSGSHMAR